jgi:hypothetical protein
MQIRSLRLQKRDCKGVLWSLAQQQKSHHSGNLVLRV